MTPTRTDPVDVEQEADRAGQTVVQLDVRSIEAIAQCIAGLIGGEGGGLPDAPAPGRLLSASEVAERWGVDRSWVYQHAERLGAIRLGDGPRPRLRFDPQQLASRLGSAAGTRTPRASANRRRSPQNRADPLRLLEIRGGPELSSHDPRASRPSGPAACPTTKEIDNAKDGQRTGS
jgi:hypothetical protein